MRPCSRPRELQGRRVATSFPRITESYLRSHGAEVHLVTISGSVEVMVALGVADAIVDLVETGSTLAANRLRILAEIGQYETVLIQNRDCRQPEMADRVVRRLEGVVIARSYSLLEYNIPKAKLAEAERITPGFKSPTVNRLEDPDWFAVRVMVPRKDVIAVMEKLEALGASAILEDADHQLPPVARFAAGGLTPPFRSGACRCPSRPTATTASVASWSSAGRSAARRRRSLARVRSTSRWTTAAERARM